MFAATKASRFTKMRRSGAICVVALVSMLSVGGGWSSEAGASASDGVTSAYGPAGSSMASTRGYCNSVRGQVLSGDIFLLPASGYAAQAVRFQIWVLDVYTGDWTYLPWSAWITTRTTAAARFLAVGTTPAYTYSPHRYSVVVRGAWRFSNGTVRTHDMALSYYANHNFAGTSFGGACYA